MLLGAPLKTYIWQEKRAYISGVQNQTTPYQNMNNVAIINGKSRFELFTGTSIGANLKHYHVFGCPVVLLDNASASGNSLPHWSPCACLGVDLVPSPDNARNVNLVLNRTTGLVSPLFHGKYDDFFETPWLNKAEATTNAAWLKAHLTSNKSENYTTQPSWQWHHLWAATWIPCQSSSQWCKGKLHSWQSQLVTCHWCFRLTLSLEELISIHDTWSMK